MKPNKRKQRHGPPSTRPINRPEGKTPSPTTSVNQPKLGRDLGIVITVWFLLVLVMWMLAAQNLSVPGLYYDEAVFAGTAKDFLTGKPHGPHMPGFLTAHLFGRPFPLFIQSYLGALKSWMLMPAFQFFGYTVAVLRASNLFWGSISLLFFMLATRRWLGLRTALIAGPLLALDPAYFFLCILDWGVAVPSLLCRFIAFFFAVAWGQSRRAPYAFLTAFFAGLGFFNKIDFAVLLIAVTIGSVICFGKFLWHSITTRLSGALFAALGFIVGGGAMLLKMPGILSNTLSGANPTQPGELTEKLNTMLALYDGSYFYRLMNSGGMFEKMYSQSVGWLPVFGIFVLIAVVLGLLRSTGKDSSPSQTRIALFLFIAIVFATLGILILPGAVRIHHAVLVYPLPHLIIAFTANLFWTRFQLARRVALQNAVYLVLFGLIASEAYGILRTQGLVRKTGGRGRWSETFDSFCRENKDRADLAIVSLDWGFNEQLEFLTDGPQLNEPFWQMRGPFPTFGGNSPALPTDPYYVYLIHPAEYSLFPFGEHYMKEAQAKRPDAEIRPYYDREKQIAFYTIRFPQR